MASRSPSPSASPSDTSTGYRPSSPASVLKAVLDRTALPLLINTVMVLSSWSAVTTSTTLSPSTSPSAKAAGWPPVLPLLVADVSKLSPCCSAMYTASPSVST